MNRFLICPNCGDSLKQYKIGKTSAGSQRYRCFYCKKSYTPYKKERGYKKEVRHKAISLYVNGFRPRRIGNLLQVHHTTISNWINDYLDNQPHKTYTEINSSALDGQ